MQSDGIGIGGRVQCVAMIVSLSYPNTQISKTGGVSSSSTWRGAKRKDNGCPIKSCRVECFSCYFLRKQDQQTRFRQNVFQERKRYHWRRGWVGIQSHELIIRSKKRVTDALEERDHGSNGLIACIAFIHSCCNLCIKIVKSCQKEQRSCSQKWLCILVGESWKKMRDAVAWNMTVEDEHSILHSTSEFFNQNFHLMVPSLVLSSCILNILIGTRWEIFKICSEEYGWLISWNPTERDA